MLNFVDWVSSNTALPDKATNALKFLRVNAAETAYEWAAVSVSNFANTDLTFSANRNHDTNGHYLQITTDAGGFAQSFLSLTASKAQYGFNNSYAEFGTYLGAPYIDFYTNGLSLLKLNSGRVGIGAEAASGTRLDVRAQGALSTDIALRVRNSANTYNLIEFNGQGGWAFKNSAGQSKFWMGGSAYNDFALGTSLSCDGFTTYLSSPSGVAQVTASGNGLILTSGYVTTLSATNQIQIATNGVVRSYFDSSGNVGIGSMVSSLGARFDVRSQGALSTDIALRVRNSVDTANLIEVNGDGSIKAGSNGKRYAFSSDGVFQWGFDVTTGNNRGTLTWDTNKVMLTTPVKFSIQTGGSERFGVTGSGVSIGWGVTDAVARLDVKAQGALSTDIAFRVRNSADTINLFDVQGDGVINARNNLVVYAKAASVPLAVVDPTGLFSNFQISTTGEMFLRGTGTPVLRIFDGTQNLRLTGGAAPELRSDVNFGFTNSAGLVHTGMNTDGTWSYIKSNYFKNTATPSAFADYFALYSDDIVAGNAAPHFRTENGDVQRIYSIGGWGTPTGTLTRTTFNTTTVTLSELAERVAAMISDIKTGHQLFKA
jgi:hypothetical protein